MSHADEDLRTPDEIDDDDLTAAVEEATEDWDRPGPGRPEIGGAALIRFGDLLPRIDARAKKQSISRPELVRRAVRAYLEPCGPEPTIEDVRRHLRSGFTTVVSTIGGSAPEVSLCRTLDEAREELDKMAEVFSRDSSTQWEVVARSEYHLVLKSTPYDLISTFTIVEEAPVRGGLATAATLGEVNLCKDLGLNPDDLWPGLNQAHIG